MNFLPIDINSKDIIKTFFNAQRIEASDMLFGNLYIWHFSREIKYCVINNNLVIMTKFKNEQYPFVFYPLGYGDRKKTITLLKEYFLSNSMPFSMRSLEEFQKNELISFFGDSFIINANRDRFDYIYKVNDLINLSGRKLHNKKNHLNRFFNLYPDFSYEAIDSTNAKEVIETYTKWFNDNQNINDGLRNEYIGIEASLKNLSLLDMKGALIRIDNKIAAFSLGEKINDNSVVIHIEKGNIFYSGIYQAINQQFLANTWNNMEFVNREEDLGLDGLRKAKMTYQPFKFIEKYNAILRS
ncbi:DUF2156 domain-containing protein [Helicobacter sp. MIT 14-3879]|uniref:DUF2156 domain-containing protein n=1 Tax=Helicobacter sp. MIT 14-3879 TaxID=2040649 RepID=UPI000E1F2E75|nr:phosphatidylglycerol lysyltransferase domain-containing protein [Helicobacter sp. MIT 14-3879]RDU64728.1 hypothetical protein CQA44_03175 [Helicobacter sp. MIT 14-3879]